MRLCSIVLVLVAGLPAVETATAYEFEVRARTIGQGYQARSFRLLGSDVTLSRRRFTQTLSLNIWDLSGRRRDRMLHDLTPLSGPDLYVSLYLRIEHDFGSWSTGSLVIDNRVFDAVDLIPELERGLVALDILYGYAAAEGLAGGWLDLYAGRLLDSDSLDWFDMDGVKARFHTPIGVSLAGFAGLRVRDSSPLASPTFEPDGTGSAECAEYVEGQNPGSGSWRPIDRQRPGDNRLFENDFDRCPQRDQIMPTFGGSVETRGFDWLWARLSYRRSMSPTPGLIGPVDRFEVADTGLYPDEVDQAPDWGVNEEFATASVRSNHRAFAGGGQITPHGAVRYNLLLGLIDQAHVGVRMRYRQSTIEPEIYYSFPSFDGDSILNVFSSQPYVDARITYDQALRDVPLSGYVRPWLRRFGVARDQRGGPGDSDNLAGGIHIGARYRRHGLLSAQVDLFHDSGYGGRRTGGYADAYWQTTRDTGVRVRFSTIYLDADLSQTLHPSSRKTTFAGQAGVTYRVAEGVVFHLVAEQNVSRLSPSQFRLLGVVDLAFVPEV